MSSSFDIAGRRFLSVSFFALAIQVFSYAKEIFIFLLDAIKIGAPLLLRAGARLVLESKAHFC